MLERVESFAARDHGEVFEIISGNQEDCLAIRGEMFEKRKRKQKEVIIKAGIEIEKCMTEISGCVRGHIRKQKQPKKERLFATVAEAHNYRLHGHFIFSKKFSYF